MRSATPARSQYRRAVPVHSSLTSHASSRPPGASPRAMQIEEYPVKVPTSTACRVPVSFTSSVSSVPWSWLICIRALSGSSRRVSAARSRSTSSAGVA